MTPREYEELVAKHFECLGYKVDLTPYSNDYGIDVFAYKDSEKIAIQVKMFGDSARKINRQMVMELYGAKDCASCKRAIIATNGKLTADAVEIADKLSIEVLYLFPETEEHNVCESTNDKSSDISIDSVRDFDSIWLDYIMPLEGKTLLKKNGKVNKIVHVDWGGINRITSNGRKQHINIEIFRTAINCIISSGSISRAKINEEYAGRASSGIVLILSQVPLFEFVNNPVGIRLKK